jgi:hypothetical protein
VLGGAPKPLAVKQQPTAKRLERMLKSQQQPQLAHRKPD